MASDHVCTDSLKENDSKISAFKQRFQKMWNEIDLCSGLATYEAKDTSSQILKKVQNYVSEFKGEKDELFQKFEEKKFLLKSFKETYEIWLKLFRDLNQLFNFSMKQASFEQQKLASALYKLDGQQAYYMSLQSSKTSRLLVFGKDMDHLLNLIDKNKTTFKEIPKGPLGSCISVKNKKWLELVETILEPYLWIFAVDNHNDSELLNSLIDKVYGKYAPKFCVQWKRPEVWVTKFYDHREIFGKETIYGHFTLLDAILFHDNYDFVIEKTLWELLPIGYILLFKSYRQLFSDDSIEIPAQCTYGYGLDFTKLQLDPPYTTRKIERLEKYKILTIHAGSAELRVLGREIKGTKTIIETLKTDIKAVQDTMIKSSESIHIIKKILYHCETLLKMIMEEKKSKGI